MVTKKLLKPGRLRRIEGGFSFIPHRFISDGFLSRLSQKELLLYLFLCLVSDRNGLSFYSYDVICSLLEICIDEYIIARDGLIKKDLIAFDGHLFQVLSLPQQPNKTRAVREERRSQIQNLIQQSLWEVQGGA
jgi:hypothetical protein